MASPVVICILIVNDHALLRQGLRLLIENQSDMRVIGDTACSEAIEAAASLKPDLILLDLDLDQENGFDLLSRLVSPHADSRVLILTGLQDVERQRRAIRLGAMGIVLKDQSGELLVKAIRTVHAGQLWIDHEMTLTLIHKSRVGNDSPPTDPQSARITSLSPRECEVVSLVGQGVGARKIADRLHISEKTVRNHLSSIYDKLELNGGLELAIYAVKHGLTQPTR